MSAYNMVEGFAIHRSDSSVSWTDRFHSNIGRFHPMCQVQHKLRIKSVLILYKHTFLFIYCTFVIYNYYNYSMQTENLIATQCPMLILFSFMCWNFCQEHLSGFICSFLKCFFCKWTKCQETVLTTCNIIHGQFSQKCCKCRE